MCVMYFFYEVFSVSDKALACKMNWYDTILELEGDLKLSQFNVIYLCTEETTAW